MGIIFFVDCTVLYKYILDPRESYREVLNVEFFFCTVVHFLCCIFSLSYLFCNLVVMVTTSYPEYMCFVHMFRMCCTHHSFHYTSELSIHFYALFILVFWKWRWYILAILQMYCFRQKVWFYFKHGWQSLLYLNFSLLK